MVPNRDFCSNQRGKFAPIARPHGGLTTICIEMVVFGPNRPRAH